MLALYSAIPYKMPWLPMSWLALLAIPAGYGALAAARLIHREVAPRIPTAIAIGSVLVPALAISWRSSLIDPADSREQLAYVHTDADYNLWFPYITQAVELVGAKNVVVAVDGDTPWPLAWALRPYPRTRWHAEGSEHVIVAAKKRAPAIEARLKGRYVRHAYRVRDSAEPIVVFLRADLFEERVGHGGWAAIDHPAGAKLAEGRH
jgi:hypothetical protein